MLIFNLAKPCLLLTQVDLLFIVGNPLNLAGGNSVQNKLIAILLMQGLYPCGALDHGAGRDVPCPLATTIWGFSHSCSGGCNALFTIPGGSFSTPVDVWGQVSLPTLDSPGPELSKFTVLASADPLPTPTITANNGHLSAS